MHTVRMGRTARGFGRGHMYPLRWRNHLTRHNDHHTASKIFIRREGVTQTRTSLRLVRYAFEEHQRNPACHHRPSNVSRNVHPTSTHGRLLEEYRKHTTLRYTPSPAGRSGHFLRGVALSPTKRHPSSWPKSSRARTRIHWFVLCRSAQKMLPNEMSVCVATCRGSFNSVKPPTSPRTIETPAAHKRTTLINPYP